MGIKLILLTVVTAFSIKSYSQSAIDSLIFRLKISSGIEKVEILNRLSEDFSLENSETARSYAQKAFILSDSLNYLKGEGYSLKNLGFIAYLKGDFETAIENIQAASEIADQLNDVALKTMVFENLALIYEESNAFEKSLQYFQFSYELNDLANNPVGKGLALIGAARIYDKTRQFDLALKNNLKAIEIFESLGNNAGVAKSSIAIAKNQFSLEEQDTGMYFFNMAEGMIRILDSEDLLLELYIEKARAYSISYTDSSLIYISKATFLAEKLDRLYLKRDLLLRTSELYSKRGDHQKAYDFHQAYNHLNDSLLNLQEGIDPGRLNSTLNDAIYSEQEVVYDALEGMHQKKSSESRLLLFGFGGVIIFITTLMIWLVFRYKSQKKSLEKMEFLHKEIASLSTEISKKEEIIYNLKGGGKKQSHHIPGKVNEADIAVASTEKDEAEIAKAEFDQKPYDAFILSQWSSLKKTREALKFSSGSISIEDVPHGLWDYFNLNAMTNSLIDLKIKSKDDKIRIHHSSDPAVNLNCDKASTLLMINCLLQNAIDSIKQEGDIYIDYYSDDIKISYRIIDTGSGISEHDKSRLFEPFYSTKNSDKHPGLGLSICQEIIKMHEAVIKIKSKPGVGTEVTLEFYYL